METQELYEASAQRRCRTDVSAHKTTIESPVAANVEDQCGTPDPSLRLTAPFRMTGNVLLNVFSVILSVSEESGAEPRNGVPDPSLRLRLRSG